MMNICFPVFLLARRGLMVWLMLAVSVPLAWSQEVAPPKTKQAKPQLRILCVRSLAEEDKIILASKTDKGKWKEYQEITLRSPFISDWNEISHGVFHLVKRQNDTFHSIGSFTITPKMKRAILVLVPKPNKKLYAIHLVDPTELDFRSGKALVMNFSKIPAVVNTGGTSIKLVQPGKKSVLSITTSKDRMFRMLVGYKNKSNGLVACYDRYVSANPKTRKFILVFPDPDTQLRVVSLSEFGPFN